MNVSTLRWRKFSPLDREWPIYELLDGETILLDVSKTDGGELEIAFHEGSGGRILSLATLERMLGEVKALLADEP